MMRRLLLVSLLGAACLPACGEEEIMTASSAPKGEKKEGKVSRSPKPKQEDEEKKEDAMPPAVEFQEADFTETERSRDPFRSFARMFSDAAKDRVKTQREVVLDQYAVDELKLIGIVSRIQPQKAMLVDPTGKGHVITRGQFVGRAEIVQGGTSGADYEINWRVERIRAADIVLVREDPANPDVPSATRVIPLRPEETG
jgi:type IV pilus assembly protein PilP